MNRSKFIRVKQLHNVRDVFILFPEIITHRDLVQSLGICTQAGLISAGFYSVDAEGDYFCYGESISLCIGRRPDDDEQLNLQMKGYYT